MSDLKPCPFCGREVTVYSSSRSYSFIFSHKGLRNCPFFQFEIMWHDAKTIKEATDLWNRRVETTIVNNGTMNITL